MAGNQYKNLSNTEYWQKRSTEIMDKKWKDINNVEAELAKQYRIALDDIRQMVTDLYIKYAKDTGLSYQDAIKALTSVEVGDYHTKLERMKPLINQTNDPKLIAEYDKLKSYSKLTRLQALVNQMDVRLIELGYAQQMTITDWLSGVYEDTYYQSIYMIQSGTGIGTSFSLLNETTVTTAITTAWSGNQFSDRIWTNKDKLISSLKQTITQGLIKGNGVQDMARSLKGTMNSNYSNALRLTRTETAYVMGEATAKGYGQSGYVYQYIYVATLDSRTSSICREEDNKVFRLKDRKVGVNYPPLHPNCRSCVAPYFGDLSKSERIARGEDGKTYKVPANMSYTEWHSKYVSK